MKLALLGGQPINDTAWPKWPRLGENAPRYLNSVLEGSRWSVSGPRTTLPTMDQRVSARFAQFCGTKYAFTMDHGSSAIVAALLAIGIGAGDEVIIPGLTWVACASAVLRANAVPVAVDICPQTLCISPEAIEAAINARTRAILVVHLYSSMADLDRIVEIAIRHDVKVIEDSAQAHGAEWRHVRAGATGCIGTFSFHQGKPMAIGEGGMVVTSDEKVASRLEQLRADGRRYGEGPIGHQHLVDIGDVQGFNLCLSEPQSALLLDALDRIESENAHRGRNADTLDRLLTDTGVWFPAKAHPANNRRTYYHYAVRFDPEHFKGCTAAVVSAALEAELGFHVHGSYPPMHKFSLFAPDRCAMLSATPWLKDVSIDRWRLPVAEQQHQRLVLLHHPFLLCENDRIEMVAAAFKKVSNGARQLASYCRGDSD